MSALERKRVTIIGWIFIVSFFVLSTLAEMLSNRILSIVVGFVLILTFAVMIPLTINYYRHKKKIENSRNMKRTRETKQKIASIFRVLSSNATATRKVMVSKI